MNLIGNNCIGGRLYEVKNIQFSNPFIWMRILPEEYIYLIKNYDNINFNNVQFSLEEFKYKDKFNVICNLDNKINIHYTHYFLDKSYDMPTQIDSNVYYKDIITYSKNKYFSRLKRMTGNPIFVFSFNKIDKKYDSNDILKKIINIDTQYNINILLNKDNFNNIIYKENINLINLTNEELDSDTKKIANLVKDKIILKS